MGRPGFRAVAASTLTLAAAAMISGCYKEKDDTDETAKVSGGGAAILTSDSALRIAQERNLTPDDVKAALIRSQGRT